jgi:hypothetical protein
MKPKKIKTKEALMASVSQELKKEAQNAPLRGGPYYQVASKHNVLLFSEVKKSY